MTTITLRLTPGADSILELGSARIMPELTRDWSRRSFVAVSGTPDTMRALVCRLEGALNFRCQNLAEKNSCRVNIARVEEALWQHASADGPKPRRGRPPLDDRRRKRGGFNDAEWARVAVAAKADGMTAAAWVRRRCGLAR